MNMALLPPSVQKQVSTWTFSTSLKKKTLKPDLIQGVFALYSRFKHLLPTLCYAITYYFLFVPENLQFWTEQHSPLPQNKLPQIEGIAIL